MPTNSGHESLGAAAAAPPPAALGPPVAIALLEIIWQGKQVDKGADRQITWQETKNLIIDRSGST
jgi:hypothetical protein